MAVTTTLKQRGKMGNMRLNVVDVDIDQEQYPAGGIDVTAAQMGLGLPYVVLPAPAGGYVFEYDHDTRKIKAYTLGSETAVNYDSVFGATYDSTDAAETADKTASATNADYFAPFTSKDTAASTWEADIQAQPDVARNLTISIYNPTTANATAHTTMAFSAVGTFAGNAQTETISFGLSASATIGAGKYRYLAGVKPFDTITSVKLAAAGAAGANAGLQYAVGPGVWFGLHGGFASHTSIKSIKVGSASLTYGSAGGTASANETVLVIDADSATKLSDGKKVRIVYDHAGYEKAEDSGPQEVKALTQITAKPRLIAIGI